MNSEDSDLSLRPTEFICECGGSMKADSKTTIKCVNCGLIREKKKKNEHKKECEKCHKYFSINDLDYHNGQMVCRECEEERE